MIGVNSRRCNFSRIKASEKTISRKTSNLISTGNDRKNKRKRRSRHTLRMYQRDNIGYAYLPLARVTEESQPWERSAWFSVALHAVIMKWIMTRSSNEAQHQTLFSAGVGAWLYSKLSLVTFGMHPRPHSHDVYTWPNGWDNTMKRSGS